MRVTWSSATSAPSDMLGHIMGEPPIVSARVLDTVQGASYSLDAAGMRHSYEDTQFNGLMQRGRSYYGLSTRLTVRAQTPWHQSSCGPNALLFLMYLLDIPRDLVDILAALPAAHAETKSSTIAELAGVCKTLGVACESLRVPIKALQQLETPVLARVRSDSDSAHFVVAESGNDTVYVTSVPDGRTRMSREEFKAIFLGEILLIGASAADCTATIRRAEHVQVLRRRYLWGSAIFAALVLIYWRQHRIQVRRSKKRLTEAT